MTVEAQGFSQKVYPNVTLEAGQKLNLNVTLAVGSVHEQVSSDRFARSAQHLRCHGRRCFESNQDRKYAQHRPHRLGGIGVYPGSKDDRGDFHAGSSLCYRQRPDSVNGSPTTTNSYFVNGAPVSNGGTWNYAPSSDAVQEVQVTVSGGVLNTVPRRAASSILPLNKAPTSFTEAFFDYYGNIIFNANSPISRMSRASPRDLDPNTRNNFGAAVSGLRF